MKHPTTSFEISLKDLQNYTQNRLFYQSLLICFLVPEKRIIFAKVQRRKRGKIRLSYHLSFKLLVVNWSNMLHRQEPLLQRTLSAYRQESQGYIRYGEGGSLDWSGQNRGSRQEALRWIHDS